MRSSQPTLSSRPLVAGALLAVGLLVASACTPAPRPGEFVAAEDPDAGFDDDLDDDFLPGDDAGELVDDDGDPTTPDVPVADAGTGSGTRGRRTTRAGSGTGGTVTTTPGGTPSTTPTGSPYRSTLFTADEDRVGITDSQITLCAHAALTYGAAFNTSDADLNVYWSAINDAGGIHGRRVVTTYENDNYTPQDAEAAATRCQAENPFMVLGGIGFDQIPAVRGWAEKNRIPYFHHTATVKGADSLKFSYTALPTTEKMGEMFAELAISKKGEWGSKVGIIRRDSENWNPGVDAFRSLADGHGLVYRERPVQQNKGNYLQDILDLKDWDADVVWVWLNALESTELIKQIKAQDWHPHLMVFPFNLTSQTLGEDALNPPIHGVAMFNAFSLGDYTGEFAKYKADMQQFEQQYAEYRPSVDLGGVGGDLLFLNWTAQKAMHKLFEQCGPDCTRNRYLELLHGYKQKVSDSSCTMDFTRPGAGNSHRGGWAVSILKTYASPSGKVNFRNIATCVEHLI